MMRVIVTGGGTGGHLFPGIALATGLQQRIPGCRIMFIGTRRLLDQQALAGYDFELASIKCMGLKGMGLGNRIQSVLQLPAAVVEARRIMKRFAPDLVFGVGGYVTGPVLLAARLSSIPLCIHEQNSVPGLANKMLARIVDRIFLSIPCRYPFPAARTLVTGNPVRREIIEASSHRGVSEKKRITILVLGGSQGAHRVNFLVADAMDELAREYADRLTLIHQTGEADEKEVRSRYSRIGLQAEVKPFFQDMAGVYSRADLVVSRAGATTLAELSVMGLPAILIPYPYAADDHQKTNGLYYQDGGAATMQLEQELNGAKLAREIRNLFHNPDWLQKMSEKMKSLGKPEATDAIINECLALIEQRKAQAGA
ncbi:MAG: undecaprenyldiphospho-muramoylpentapeptide beta-N-acetylglucosaminyltransferase [Desulfobulbaceae bacterium]|nr:undecaprenyldiphospho-muramoylpentapeptide beta-N-acetylglucosaminyltransferase [Desulfobulbaceae bacterium]